MSNLLTEAVEAFHALAIEVVYELPSDETFGRYVADDPPVRLRALVIGGALTLACATEKLTPHNDSDEDADQWVVTADETETPDELCARRLWMSALNDEPDFARDVLEVHENTYGEDGVVGVAYSLVTYYIALGVELTRQ